MSKTTILQYTCTTISYLSVQQSELSPRGAVDDPMHCCPRLNLDFASIALKGLIKSGITACIKRAKITLQQRLKSDSADAHTDLRFLLEA